MENFIKSLKYSTELKIQLMNKNNNEKELAILQD